MKKRMIIITKIAWYGDRDFTEKLIQVQDAGQSLNDFLDENEKQVRDTAYQLEEDSENNDD